MKVFYYCNFPSPYYIGFLDELGKLCDLTAVFERENSSERDSSWKKFVAPNIKNLIILHGIHTKADMAFCPQITKYIKKDKFDAYIVHDPASPTGMWLIRYMKRHKIPFILQSEGGFPGDGISSFKERFKKKLMSGAQLYLSTMSLDREYFLSYGAIPDKLYRYPFASFYENDILARPLSVKEKKELRDKLGITENKVIVSVGRIIQSKGFDVLLKSLIGISKDVGTYIISGQPTEELKKIKEENDLSNVYFVDFMSKDELWKYYQMADFFALPTRSDTWGLFVNEAMANGLPVITTNMSIAGLELINDYENGFLIEKDDVETLRKYIDLLLYDEKLCASIALNNIEKIKWYTFENQAKETMKAITEVLKNE